MLTLSPTKHFINANSRTTRYHSWKVKEGISGFPVIQRRTMFWFAARTAWMVTKTAGGLVLTRTAGDRLNYLKNLIVTKPAEIGLKPATSFVKNYFAERAIANGPTKLRNTLFNIARLIYSAILSFVTYLAIELYNISNVVVTGLSKYLIGVFNFGKELLTALTGTLSDAMMVTYTIFYLILLASMVYILFRLVHHLLYSLFAFRSLMRSLVDTVTVGAEEEQKNEDDKFHDEVREHLNKSTFGSGLVTEKVGPNAVLVRKTPEPITPTEGIYDDVAKREADRFIAENKTWMEQHRAAKANASVTAATKKK